MLSLHTHAGNNYVKLLSVHLLNLKVYYNKTCVKRPLPKRSKIGFQEQLSHIAGQKHLHSTIISTFIKLPFVIKIFVLSFFSDRFTQVLL